MSNVYSYNFPEAILEAYRWFLTGLDPGKELTDKRAILRGVDTKHCMHQFYLLKLNKHKKCWQHLRFQN